MLVDMKIAFIGMMGCGKSTIGEELHKKINLKYIDIDEYIERNENKKITDIFNEKGEGYFRKIENNTIVELSNKDNIILSTGGGIIKNKDNINILKNKNFIIIFIERSIDKIAESIKSENRPLIKDNIDKLYSIYNEREKLYKDYSDYIIENNDSLENAVDKIITLVKNVYGEIENKME